MVLSRDFTHSLLLSIFCIVLIFACQTTEQVHEIKRIKKEITIVDKTPILEAWKRFQPNKYENGFLAYDFNKKRLVKLDDNFEFLEALGAEGDSPTENRMILNFQQLDRDWVAIFETEKNTFKIQNWQDSVKVYFKFPERFERGVLIGDSLIYYTFFDGKDVRLRFASRNTKKDFDFESLSQLNELVDEPVSGFIYEGAVSASKDFFYNFSGLYTEFVRINLISGASEKLNYGIRPNTSKPKVLEVAGGYYAPNNPIITIDAKIHNGLIYTLSNVSTSDFGKKRVIDVYQEIDFKYLYTFSLEKLGEFYPTEIFLDSEYLYVLQENEICKLSLDLD
jgi:hypothetical protein